MSATTTSSTFSSLWATIAPSGAAMMERLFWCSRQALQEANQTLFSAALVVIMPWKTGIFQSVGSVVLFCGCKDELCALTHTLGGGLAEAEGLE